MSDHYYDCDGDSRLKLEYLYNLLDQEDQQETYSEELKEFFKLMEINESGGRRLPQLLLFYLL